MRLINNYPLDHHTAALRCRPIFEEEGGDGGVSDSFFLG